MITINIIIAITFRLLFYCHYCVSTRKLERAVKLFTPHLCKKKKQNINCVGDGGTCGYNVDKHALFRITTWPCYSPVKENTFCTLTPWHPCLLCGYLWSLSEVPQPLFLKFFLNVALESSFSELMVAADSA